MHRATRIGLFVLGCAIGLVSCGGGGSSTSSLIAVGVAGLDGTIQLESITGLCEIDSVTARARAGEDEASPTKFRTFWGFVTFDHAALPAGADVRSATARIRMAEVQGDNVFGAGVFGNVVMEHIDLGATLEETDMTSASLSGEVVGGNASPTFLATDATLGLKSVDITDEVRRDRDDGRTRTTLRLRFELTEATDSDAVGDFAEFFTFDAADTANAQRPSLDIRFRD